MVAIQQLAQDLPTHWTAATTSVLDRKEILRAVVERIVLRVINHSEQVEVTIVWAGGWVTQAVVERPVQRVEQLSHYAQICEEVRLGVADGETVRETAARLNTLGLRSPRSEGWGKQAVQELTIRLGLRRKRTRRPMAAWTEAKGAGG